MMNPETGTSPGLRERAYWLIPCFVCALLIAPQALTDRAFGGDWTNHLWLIWVQGNNIVDFGAPDYYFHTTRLGAYYPFYAFYGGPIYTLGGLLSIVTSPIASFTLLYLMGFTAAYAGWTWLCLQAGIRGWLAFVPGCIAVTAAYSITMAFGRGDFAESFATSMLPLVAASALSIFRSDRIAASTAAVYVLSLVLMTGTHTLTLVWGSTFLLAVASIAAIIWRHTALERGRRLLQIAGMSALGVAINLWYLVPLTAYSHRILIGERPGPLTQTEFTQFKYLISPLRATPQIWLAFASAGGIQAQLPVLAILAASVLAVFAWRYMDRRRRRLLVSLVGLLAAVVALILFPDAIENLPRAWRFVQFPYRLVTYATFAAIGIVILVLAGAQRVPHVRRAAPIVFAAIAAIGLSQAMVQMLGGPIDPGPADYKPPERGMSTASLIKPPPGAFWTAPRDFGDVSAPIIDPAPGERLHLPISRGNRTEYEVPFPAGPARMVVTNVATGSYFVHVAGAEIVGRTQEQELVLRLPRSRSSGVVRFSPRRTTAVAVARVASIAAALGAVALIGALALRGRGAGGAGPFETECPRAN